MTQNQKIAIGIGALALGYWLYTKNKANKSVETPATSSNPANIKLPEGSTIFVRSHEYIPTTIEKRENECKNRLVEALKTKRPDDLQGFKITFMRDCLSKDGILYDACQSKLANVRMTPQGYKDAIAQCMGCSKGQIYNINSANGKLGCITPRTDGRI